MLEEPGIDPTAWLELAIKMQTPLNAERTARNLYPRPRVLLGARGCPS